jgi:hypothetical protein
LAFAVAFVVACSIGLAGCPFIAPFAMSEYRASAPYLKPQNKIPQKQPETTLSTPKLTQPQHYKPHPPGTITPTNQLKFK